MCPETRSTNIDGLDIDLLQEHAAARSVGFLPVILQAASNRPASEVGAAIIVASRTLDYWPRALSAFFEAINSEPLSLVEIVGTIEKLNAQEIQRMFSGKIRALRVAVVLAEAGAEKVKAFQDLLERRTT